MGSRARNSTGRKATSAARKGKRSAVPRKPSESSSPDFEAILGRLSDALAIIATATSAMEAGQALTAVTDAAEPADKIFCLGRGVGDLRRVYNELDVAILEVAS